ncbi:MAG TPA: TRAP transporter small permease [Kofleriaceae bacterium]|nr:TRAP transporter small permease [Kofleriaceae bacterium]
MADDQENVGRLIAPEPDSVQMIRKVDASIGVLEHILVAGFLVMLVGVAVFQVAASKFFGYREAWSSELIQFSVFLIAMAGAALAAQTDQMISMDFVTRMVKPRARVILRVVTRVFTIVMCGFLMYGGWWAREHGYRGAGEAVVDIRTVILALPLGAGLMAFHQLMHGLIDVIYLSRGETPPEPEEPSVH